jgi:hypothetical protein
MRAEPRIGKTTKNSNTNANANGSSCSKGETKAEGGANPIWTFLFEETTTPLMTANQQQPSNNKSAHGRARSLARFGFSSEKQRSLAVNRRLLLASLDRWPKIDTTNRS